MLALSGVAFLASGIFRYLHFMQRLSSVESILSTMMDTTLSHASASKVLECSPYVFCSESTMDAIECLIWILPFALLSRSHSAATHRHMLLLTATERKGSK